MHRTLSVVLLVACGGLPDVDVSLSPQAATVEDTLVAVVQDGDTVLPSSELSLTWTVDGEPVGADPQLVLAPFSKGQVVEVSAAARDGDRTGEASITSVTIANALPVVNNASIEPSSPTSADTLSLEVFTRDADDDGVSTDITWFVDGTEAGSGSELSGVFVRGSSVEAEIVPSDGEGVGEAFRTDAVTLDNGPPAAPEPTLTVEREWVPSPLRCTVETVPEDPDGDDVDIELRWVIRGLARPGEVRPDRTLTATTEETASGGTWTCEARAVDSEGAASPWVAAEDVTDQTCDRDTVTLTGAWSASLAYNNGTSWNDTTLRAYTFGNPGGNEDIVGWLAFDLRPLGTVNGLVEGTLDLHTSGSLGDFEIVVVQTSAGLWSPDAPTTEGLPREGEISDVKRDLTPGERTRFALDLDAWTEGPGPDVDTVTIGVDNLASTYSYGFFSSVKATAFQPELELTVCR